MKTFFFLFMLSSVWLFHPATSHPVDPLMLDESNLANTDILPIKPIEPLTVSSFSCYLLFSAMMIAMISILFTVLRRKRKNLLAIQKQIVLLSPYLEAMSAINQLEKEEYCENKKRLFCSVKNTEDVYRSITCHSGKRSYDRRDQATAGK